MDVDTILKEVIADKSYYENSGGGLTVSGGEPMLQFPFLEALLGEAKTLGLYICLETSGFARKELFARIAGNVDLFLYDIKHINDEKHKKYTGVSNQIILDNLDYLYRMGAKIRLRCPLIPGVNDTAEHIGGLRRLRGSIRSSQVWSYCLIMIWAKENGTRSGRNMDFVI